MRPSRYSIAAVLFLVLCQIATPGFSQLGISFDIKKPKEYDERVLRSEKSDQKKFNVPRRLIQNTVTHYNYYFNANNKLNEVLERAKTSFTDDFSKLLPFYNYSLDMTAKDSIQLDSITYKSMTGIALHDLRNDWVDNLYLLWGASYYLQKDFDSAYLMFQFINYAFAPKEKDGYYVTIGSKMDGNSAFSIATKEKTSLPRKIFSEPPSRNEAFIWQIRNFLAQDQFAEAASLIVTLRNDPVFPKRLQNDLHEVQAYWFYKQHMWDSAAAHLVMALDNASNKQEKARWEYLAAQLYELTGQFKESEKYFAKVIGHTTDPIMDIYARLFSIKVNKDSSENYIDKNIAQLVKMAKRDKYVEYRDIIYYMAAQMQLERNNIDGALSLLEKSTQYSSANIAQRNKAFLQLAELSYNKKEYRRAYNFYDSLQLDDPTLTDPDALTRRKEMLGRIATNFETVERQDSLQRIAAMPEEERRDFVRKMVKQLRKQQGLKDESVSGPSIQVATPTLFPSPDSKGEWYFYNDAYRTRGIKEFKTRWGNRPNIDNWRRSSSVMGNMQNNQTQNQLLNNQSGSTTADNEITFEGLYNKLPLTEALLKVSNDSIQTALLALAKVYIQEVEDCDAGTAALETLRTRYPGFNKMDEVLFNLYYCYNKSGETAKAAAIKKLMSERFPESNLTAIVTTGKNPKSGSGNEDATKAYEKVYDLFVEGDFAEAIVQKKIADSLYGRSYWTPQLRYIEAVYYIRQKEDSLAQIILRDIINTYTPSPISQKATTLLDVVSRRKQIEAELNALSITRNDDTTSSQTGRPVIANNKPVTDTTTFKPTQPVVTNPVRQPTDTTTKKPVQPNINTPYAFKAGVPHYVVLILNKVDPVFVNEAKNAFFRYNRETFYNKIMSTEIVNLDADNRLLLISPFATSQEAVDYIDKTKPKTATEIIPWLKGGKYTFSIITDSNLELLKNSKDLENYRQFLNIHVPGKF